MALVAIVPVFGCGSGSPVPLAAPTPPTFGQPKNIGPTINSSDFDGGPSVSADELSLYFISDRPPSAGGDIWMATRASASEPFANPQRLGPEVNSPNSEGAPSILADGLELFFDRAPDGHIFVSTRASTSVSFRTAMALSLGNAVCCDGFPAISADGLELYFCSNRVGGSGGDDIWVAVRPTLSQPFGPPRTLGPTVNVAPGTVSPASPETAWSCSSRPIEPAAQAVTTFGLQLGRTDLKPSGSRQTSGPDSTPCSRTRGRISQQTE